VLPSNPDPGGLIGSLPAGGGVRDIAITPDGTRAYVTNPGTNNVAALDIQHAVGLASIPVGLRPQGVDILPTGKRAYVTNTGGNDVSVIDVDPLSPAYNTVVNTITVGRLPIGIVARGQKVYVLNTGSATLDVIDADPGHATYDHIVASGNTGSTGGGGIDVNGDGGLAYASTSGGISVIDLRTNPPSLRDTIAIPTGVVSIAIRPNQSSALALALDGTLYVIDIVPGSPNENRVVASGNTGSKGGGTVDVSGDGSLAYVSNPDGNVVYVFQLVDGVAGQAGAIRPGSIVPGPAVTLVPLPPIAVGSGPAGIATDPLGRFTLVANSGSGTVSIIGFATSLPSLPLSFDFDPNALNLNSHGRWVTAYLEPAPPRTASEIDIPTIRLNGVVAVATDGPTEIGDHDGNGLADLMVKLPRAAVELILPAGDAVPVTITGTIGPRTFEGRDTVKVKRAKMLAPVANAVLAPHHAYQLKWEVPGGTKSATVAVLHSFDHGVSWITDAMNISNTGKYDWMVPDTITDSVRVAVVQIESSNPATGDIEGVLASSDPFHISGTTSVDGPPAIVSFARVQPNPARGLARMRFGVPVRAAVELDVFDLMGRHVRTLARGVRDPGWYAVEWRGETDGGGRIGAGIYFARFRSQGRELRQRFTLLQ
jgi:YVTN family beta-propeller protein